MPSIGRIVHYVLSASDAAQINKRRRDAKRTNLAQKDTGAVIHYGTSVSGGDVVPLIVTRVGANRHISGQAFLNGNDTLFVNGSVPCEVDHEGNIERLGGRWFWPPRV